MSADRSTDFTRAVINWEDEKVIIKEHGFVILGGALDRKHIATVYDMRNQVTNM